MGTYGFTLNFVGIGFQRDDIVITMPAKGSEVVVMDKPEYIRLLSVASVDNNSKFSHVDNLLSTQNVSNY